VSAKNVIHKVDLVVKTTMGLDFKTWLSLSVVGTVVATLGALLGVLLKDYFFSRSFERWKQAQLLEQTYQRFRDPLQLSTRELLSRLAEILKDYPAVYLKKSVYESAPTSQSENSFDDPYFQRYKLISTLYRLCAFLGWLELYRQEITFLGPSNNKHAKSLEEVIRSVRSDFADGHLNKNEDWYEWRDALIFREELRAIGEAMIETCGESRRVMGYGRFCEQIGGKTDCSLKVWIDPALNFLLELEVNKSDFRKDRMQFLVKHLLRLYELLDGNPLDEYLLQIKENWVQTQSLGN